MTRGDLCRLLRRLVDFLVAHDPQARLRLARGYTLTPAPQAGGNSVRKIIVFRFGLNFDEAHTRGMIFYRQLRRLDDFAFHDPQARLRLARGYTLTPAPQAH